MAEEIISLSVTPEERTVPDEGNLRRKTGKPSSSSIERNILPHYRRASIVSCHDGGNSRRNSTGRPSSPNSGQNILPHYLRASTGSCHDFCKYGRKHELEVKARRPIPKRITPPPSDKQNPKGTVLQAQRKKMMVAKLKPSPVSKTHSPDPPEIIKREVVPPEKVEVSLKQGSSNDKKMTENEKKMKTSAKCAPSMKPKPVTLKPSSSSNISVGLNDRSNSDSKNGRKTGSSKAAVKKLLPPTTASLSPKPSVSRVVSLNARNHRSLKLVSPLKDQNRMQKAEPRQPNNDKVQEKTLRVVKTEPENKILESIQNVGSIQLPPSPSLPSPKCSSYPNSPSLSSYEGEYQEESEYTDSEADEGEDQEESEYTDSEADDLISENDETVKMNEAEISEGNQNMTLRKGGVVLSEDKDCTPMKLKFRRGKVVNLRSEKNGPRKLRFRQGRVLEGNQDIKGDARKRSFKKRGVDDDTNGTNHSSEKVLLRHQDVQGKKDAQGLFNNVIEETASKLVESRKSKVKALVGAFETVISLQESKPSTPTAT